MARFFEPTAKQIKGWAKWAAKRPPVIQALAARFDPWTLYSLNGQRVSVLGFNEDGTVSVALTGEFNLVTFDRHVFGVDPDNLTECDLPDDDEPLGTLIAHPSEEDFAAMREMMGIRHKHEVH
jgi:hypothetical protein